MRYGMPYKGSKNSIAEWIVSELPRANTFIDLFMGGGAVTHAALLSGKYKEFIINDIDERLSKMFVDCINGKYTTETRIEWISREAFFEKKDKDAYIALAWSFNNNGKDYLYSKEIESLKKAFHYAVFFDDYSFLEREGIKIPRTDKKAIYERYTDIKKALQRFVKDPRERVELQSLENLQALQQLQSLENLQALQHLQALQSDYRRVNIPSGALIYCDIPYTGTNCGKYEGFNHAQFYEWAKEQDNIYISEYSMPAEDFIKVARINKRQLSTANGTAELIEERIYTNKKTYYKLSKERKRKAMLNMAEQTTIFDFIER